MHEVHRTNVCRHEGKAKNGTPRGDLKIFVLYRTELDFTEIVDRILVPV